MNYSMRELYLLQRRLEIHDEETFDIDSLQLTIFLLIFGLIKSKSEVPRVQKQFAKKKCYMILLWIYLGSRLQEK